MGFITDLFYGKLNPLKFKIGDKVFYPADGFETISESGNKIIIGYVDEIEQGRGDIPNYYTIESKDLLHIDGKPLPVGVCETKISLWKD